MLSTCNRTEVYAVAERFHGAYADIRDLLLRTRRPDRRRTPPAPVQPARQRRGHPSVRGRRRSRLGRARRERDPRPGPNGVGDGAARRRGPLDAESALPLGTLDRQAGPHRDGHRPRYRIGQPCRRRDDHRHDRRTERQAGPRRRRRVDGRGCCRCAPPGRRRRHRRHQSHRRSWSIARRTGQRRGARLRSSRRGDRCIRRDRGRDGSRTAFLDAVARRRRSPQRDASAPHRRHRGSPQRRSLGRRTRRCQPVEPRRPARLGRPWAVAPSRRGRTCPLDRRARRSSTTSSIRPPARPLRSWPRCTKQPTVSAPASSSGTPHVSANSTSASARRSSALTRAIVAKLLHEPSVRLKSQAGTPQGERNAAAVRDLFDLG